MTCSGGSDAFIARNLRRRIDQIAVGADILLARNLSQKVNQLYGGAENLDISRTKDDVEFAIARGPRAESSRIGRTHSVVVGTLLAAVLVAASIGCFWGLLLGA